MDVFQQFGAAILVIAIMIGVLWALKAKLRGPGGALLRRRSSTLQCVDRLALTQQHSLHVVRVGTQLLVLGAGPGGVNLIREIAADTAVPARGLE